MKFWAPVLLASAVLGAGSHAATLTIAVSNIKTERGELNFAVYDNKQDWLGDTVVDKRSLVVAESLSDGIISIRFELAPGEYAVSVHHDDNDNGKMDTNFIGIPKEPTGTSNNAPPRMGPPRYKDAAFTLGEDGVEIPIKLLD